MSRVVFAVLLSLAVTSCKLNVIAPRGGEVQSVASGTCLEQSVCVHDIADSTYTETFTAVPANGFTFVRWNTGGNFLCPDSTDPVCIVDSTILAGIVSDDTINSVRDVYIKPVFTDLAEITDTILADGKEWANPRLFSGGVDILSTNIFAVCPEAAGGACSGSLMGYSMLGWTFASAADVTSLFNSFIPGDLLGPAPATAISTSGTPPAWIDALFDAGFVGSDGSLDGDIFFSAAYREVGGTGGIAQWFKGGSGLLPTIVRTLSASDISATFPSEGAFFYRTPAP